MHLHFHGWIGCCVCRYVTTRNDVLSFFTGSRKHVAVPGDGRVVLSGSGCDFHCCTIVDDAAQSLVVGNEDGVFFFSPEVRLRLQAQGARGVGRGAWGVGCIRRCACPASVAGWERV